MFRNYLTTAWRNMIKNKVFSIINVFGLALGLSVCFLITLFVVDELSYDRYSKNFERIFRVNSSYKIGSDVWSGPGSPGLLGETFLENYPQIESFTRMDGGRSRLVSCGIQTYREENFYEADPNVFEFFSLKMISGNPKTALTRSKSLVLSESTARKYFNSTNVVGKMLKLNNETPYQVTGVIKDIPRQSDFHFNIISSTVEDTFLRSDWRASYISTYVLAKPGIDQAAVDLGLNDIALKHILPAMLASDQSKSAQKGSNYARLTAMPLAKVHLYSSLLFVGYPGGNIHYIYFFSLIGILILAIACINFMNLSTARSSKRAKEVGVRKVLGSDRKNLIWQFLLESLLTSFFAFILGCMMSIVLLPALNQMSGKMISFNSSQALITIAILFLVTLVVGLLAGSYPAFFLSSFKPALVLKGKLSSGGRTNILRNIFVVFQFSAALTLIVGTLVIYGQLTFVRSAAPGYSRSQLLLMRNSYSLYMYLDAFKNEVLKIEGVESATRANMFPTDRSFPSTPVLKSSFDKHPFGVLPWEIDPDYIPTLGMKVIKGRNFSDKMKTDTMAVLINESAARALNFRNPLQKTLFFGAYNRKEAFHIIGVVKDFTAGSMREKSPPIVFMLTQGGLADHSPTFCFRINSRDIPSVVRKIHKLYNGFPSMEGQPFIFSFMDEEFNKLYEEDEKAGNLFLAFASIAVLIACLGMFGLVTFVSEQRTKEIGIRKVLGASVKSIVTLLSLDFIKLILLSMVIAFPLGWIFMNKWLEDFAYKFDFGWAIFALATIFAFLIAAMSTGFQAVKAALTNPVESLKVE